MWGLRDRRGWFPLRTGLRRASFIPRKVPWGSLAESSILGTCDRRQIEQGAIIRPRQRLGHPLTQLRLAEIATVDLRTYNGTLAIAVYQV